MPKISWSINLDGQTNVIDLDYGTYSGKRIIYVNGLQVHKSNKFFDLGTSKHLFQIGSHKCEITIRVFMDMTYSLFVNGQPQGERRLTYSQLIKTQPLWGRVLFFITVGFYYVFGLKANLESVIEDFPRLVPFTILLLAVNVVIWIVSSNQIRSIWLRFPLCFLLTLIYAISVIYLGCSCRVAS